MKVKVLLAALVCLGISGTQAFAEPEASMEFTIEGMAEKVCIMPQPEIVDNVNTSFTSGQKVTITDMINDADATLNAASIRLKFPDVMCNYPAKVMITTAQGGLIRSDPGVAQARADSAEFAEKIDYRFTGNWGGLQLPEFTTTAISAGYVASIDAGGANKADLIVNLTVDAQDIPVLTGGYADNITVKVGMNP